MDNPLKHFSELRDPRVERNREHLLEEILLISIAAVLSGAESWNDIAEYGEDKLVWLKTFLTLRGTTEDEDPVHLVHAAHLHLPYRASLLQPAEALLHQPAAAQADRIAFVPRRPAVHVRAAALVVLVECAAATSESPPKNHRNLFKQTEPPLLRGGSFQGIVYWLKWTEMRRSRSASTGLSTMACPTMCFFIMGTMRRLFGALRGFLRSTGIHKEISVHFDVSSIDRWQSITRQARLLPLLKIEWMEDNQ